MKRIQSCSHTCLVCTELSSHEVYVRACACRKADPEVQCRYTRVRARPVSFWLKDVMFLCAFLWWYWTATYGASFLMIRPGLVSVCGSLSLSSVLYPPGPSPPASPTKGFDGHRQDQIGGAFGGFAEEDFRFFTHQLVRTAERCCEGRVVSVLEGGYSVTGGVSSALAASVKEHLRGMLRTAAGTTKCSTAVRLSPRDHRNVRERGTSNPLDSSSQGRSARLASSDANRRLDIAREMSTASCQRNVSDRLDSVTQYNHMDVEDEDEEPFRTRGHEDEDDLDPDLVCLRKQCEDILMADEARNQQHHTRRQGGALREREGKDFTTWMMEHDPEVGDSAVSEVTASDVEECWSLLNHSADVETCGGQGQETGCFRQS